MAMETKKDGLWWMKPPTKQQSEDSLKNILIPKLDLKGITQSVSLTNILTSGKSPEAEVDVGSILEEISRVAAQSPLGPYENSIGDRSIDDIMKETERVYMESSKSFEQLSQISKTSQNISDLLTSNSKLSTPTPKSVSPLPLDPDVDSSSEYSEDFFQADSDKESMKSEKEKLVENKRKTTSSSSNSMQQTTAKSMNAAKDSFKLPLSPVITPQVNPSRKPSPLVSPQSKLDQVILPETTLVPCNADKENNKEMKNPNEYKIIKFLEHEKELLEGEVKNLKRELESAQASIDHLQHNLAMKTLKSPELNVELSKVLEELKDTQEINTSLHLQLETANKTHQLLKNSYDDVLTSNKSLERRVLEMEATLAKYKAELVTVQETKTKLLENEINLNKLLEMEKEQSKQLRLQNEKSVKCIQDLNRQIKEMERIIARKHPDSVSALIVAAKEDSSNTNLTARKLLEDRIKTLEQEVADRDSHSSKIFLEIQDKFNQMKNKYESHIEDLELHVSDLKNQLKNRKDTYDIYTQTVADEKKIPQKESFSKAIQTDNTSLKAPTKSVPLRNKVEKEDTHLLATIRGLQTDLSNKEKVIVKLQKEVEEMRKTTRRLQKEREGSLRNLSEKFKSYPEKLSSYARSDSEKDVRKDEELLHQTKVEKDKLKQQLSRLEGDYQNLKKKRLEDLTALQEAHEREINNYVSSITPLREQLELQQASLKTLQEQLTKAKEELAVVIVERDHLNTRLLVSGNGGGIEMEEALLKKIGFMEKRYEERESRLRAIVHSLAQKSVTNNRSCEQCAERQQQLIGYKVELDQLLASVRALK
ncbi:hypothetical protein ABEB36_009809 [Hypothenemus hampei]|uniref:Centrosomal protein of 162 kDa n=1 Tax=Hypothenemus hampei TaxID=57062 RepID=A0ABD1EHI7_HYPHA